MLGITFVAQPTVSSIHDSRRRAAARAETMALMPIDQCFRLRNNRRVFNRHFLRGCAPVAQGAEPGERPGVMRVRCRGNVECEYCRFSIESEKNAWRAFACERVRNS